MARVLGKSGRYVSQQASNKSRAIWTIAITSVGLLAAVAGCLLGLSLPFNTVSLWFAIAESAVTVATVIVIARVTNRKLDLLEKQRRDMRRGAAGEGAVALVLADFPDEFCVINDLTTPFGNLDHVVIGPTGVFLIDAKNWRGVVSADGKGELLHNEHPTDKPLVKQFVARIMSVKEKVRGLAPGLCPYFQAVFVFTSARVNAKWGSTGNVHCVRDDQLPDYIVEKDFGKKLNAHEIRQIAQAFLALAHMDADFGSNMAFPTIARRPEYAHSVQEAG